MAREVDKRGSGAGTPAESGSGDVQAFVEAMKRAPRPAPGRRGRLVFALDATASRQPTWDRACDLQAEMFQVAASLGGLDVQLVFYRGFGECKASRWMSDPMALARVMTGVSCLAGRTQIARVLRHGLKAAREQNANALVFVGDAMEEDPDELGDLAGQLGLVNLPCFFFHEGRDPLVRSVFAQIGKLSGGACCAFDPGAPQQLRDLLAAVAAYAAGGRQALLEVARSRGGAALQLTDRRG